MIAQVSRQMSFPLISNLTRNLGLIVLAFLLLGSIPAIQSSHIAPRADQGLLTLAAQHPARSVAVIVRVAQDAQGIEQRITKLGGSTTDNLSIIHSLAAKLPAGSIPSLAQMNGVMWISPDAGVKNSICATCVSAANLTNTYIKAIRADKVWEQGFQGQGIGVAVIDSGVNFQTDLYTVMGFNRVVASAAFNSGYNRTFFDAYSHGSNIAGIIAGNGRMSNGKYIGVAPLANIINVKVSDDLNNGAGTASSVVKGMQWVLINKTRYNIRVVNLSLNSDANESYKTNPIDAAAEILWNNGVVVITSSGNRGAGTVYPPANDPFVITVGASDDKGTIDTSDDSVASFSAYGTTSDGFSKPDIIAPGKNIISLMGNMGMGLPAAHPKNIVAGSYFRMSGTSVSAPMVSAAVALLLQHEPTLNPDQVKYRLLATAKKSWPAYNAQTAGAGLLDVYAAINTSTSQTANANIIMSGLLSNNLNSSNQDSVNWNSVNWNSVNWNSVNWNSVNWNSVNWNSDYWGDE